MYQYDSNIAYTAGALKGVVISVDKAVYVAVYLVGLLLSSGDRFTPAPG